MSITLEHTIVKSETVRTQYDEAEVLKKLRGSWITSNKCVSRTGTQFTPSCINSRNQFEDWEDTGHGSGITYTQDATPEQLEIYSQFNNLIALFEKQS